MTEIEKLFGILSPGALYPIETIKDLYSESFDNVSKKDLENLSRKIRSECLKTEMPVIQKIKINKKNFYRLNPEISFAGIREEIESQNIKGMASSILNIILNENNKQIKQWINKDMSEKMKNIIEEKVKEEFSKEILPVLIENMDIKIAKSISMDKDRLRSLCGELLSDLIENIKETP